MNLHRVLDAGTVRGFTRTILDDQLSSPRRTSFILRKGNVAVSYTHLDRGPHKVTPESITYYSDKLYLSGQEPYAGSAHTPKGYVVSTTIGIDKAAAALQTSGLEALWVYLEGWLAGTCKIGDPEVV